MSILKDYSELKAQIRLSPYANFIIQSDIINFKVTKASSMPAFINKIVYNLYEAWDTYKVYKDKGNEEISKQSSDYSIINNILMLNFTETKKTKSLCKPIRLKISAELSRKLNENSKYSEYEVWNAENVKEMLEFYARLSYDIRERIIFKETFHIIENAIENNEFLVITQNKNKYHVKPYMILKSSPAVYSYLVCKSAILNKENRPKEYKTAVFRISYLKNSDIRIADKNLKSNEDNILNADDINELTEAIKMYDIQFLTFEPKEFKIRLTPTGIDRYNKHIHIRPKYVSDIEKCDDGSAIYTFECTEQQIKAYFFKFGEEAEILSPAKTRKQFKENYEKALKLYQD